MWVGTELRLDKRALLTLTDPSVSVDATLCQTCKMSHGRDETCKSVPWKEWLIETGPEEIYEDDAAAPDGE